jgi:hypothetical protein
MPMTFGRKQMRRAAKTDSNHAEIRDYLRSLGITVADTARLGGGFPDLVWSLAGITGLIEIKDKNVTPNLSSLTEMQRNFKYTWQGNYAIVNSKESAWEHVRDCVYSRPK